MRRLPTALLPLALVLAACQITPDYDRPLDPGAAALLPVTDYSELPDFGPQWRDRDEIGEALDRSITWTHREHARQFFPIAGIDHDLALRSLEAFRELLFDAGSAAEFDERLKRDFQVYKSAGWDGRGGGVMFTGYCTPIFDGRLEPDSTYQYPLYALPPDLEKGPQGTILGWRSELGLLPYPSRRAIEAGGLLEDRGLELVWLADPLDAYIAHVNGSAFIRLEDGSMYRCGYAGKNGRQYSSLGRELIDDGVVPADQMSLQGIRDWGARTDTETVMEYLNRNDSYVFFQPIAGNPHGSLDFPVQALRSLATDKTLFPRGALVYVHGEFPDDRGGHETFSQFMFDQDTGGAIRTAGRADVYFGIGLDAEEQAGRVHSPGQLYYFFLE